MPKRAKAAAGAGGVSEKLRAMLRATEDTDYEIAKRSGVARNNVGRFLAGAAKLSGESVDRVCAAYGFALVDTRSGRKPRAARPAAVVATDDRAETTGQAVDPIRPPEGD